MVADATGFGNVWNKSEPIMHEEELDSLTLNSKRSSARHLQAPPLRGRMPYKEQKTIPYQDKTIILDGLQIAGTIWQSSRTRSAAILMARQHVPMFANTRLRGGS